MPMNFRELVLQAARAGRSDTQRPRPMLAMAKRCGMSRAHLYALMLGTKGAPDWTVHKLAKGLDVTPEAVRESLAVTAAQAKVLS